MADDITIRLAADLDDAFPALVRLHQDAVFATALRLTGNWHDAEEVAQEAFLRAHRNLVGWPPERVRELRPRAWLCTIAVNLARNRARDAGRRPAAGDGLDEAATAASGADGPEALALRGDDRRLLAEALHRLPAAQREAVVLRHVAGLPYAEIAEALGTPVGTVKAHVHRGIRVLASLLGEARPATAVKPALVEVS